MRKSLVLITLIVSVLLYACKHTPPELVTDPGNGGGGGGTGGGATAVCFESDILPIFQSNCAKSGCHDAASHNDGYVFDNYANIVRKDVRPFDAAGSKVYKVLFETDPDDVMPPPPNAPLTADQKNLIGRWINEGAKNTSNCGTSCDPTQFKFAANIQPILQNYCVGCHSGTSPAGGVNLTTYQGVRPYASNGILVKVITHTPGFPEMPMGTTQLPDCKIQQIKNWVQGGFPNN